MSVPCEEAGPLQDFKPDNTGRRQHCVFDVGSAGGHLRVYAQEWSEAVATPLHLCNPGCSGSSSSIHSPPDRCACTSRKEMGAWIGWPAERLLTQSH